MVDAKDFHPDVKKTGEEVIAGAGRLLDETGNVLATGAEYGIGGIVVGGEYAVGGTVIGAEALARTTVEATHAIQHDTTVAGQAIGNAAVEATHATEHDVTVAGQAIGNAAVEATHATEHAGAAIATAAENTYNKTTTAIINTAQSVENGARSETASLLGEFAAFTRSLADITDNIAKHVAPGPQSSTAEIQPPTATPKVNRGHSSQVEGKA